jgi:predicted ATPase/DNA-binding XRE family transcriptional regulator
MDVDAPEPLGRLVRRYRRDAELSQEALAERAGLSVRAVRDVESGSKHRPRRDTVDQLIAALGVPEEEQAAFLAVAAVPAEPPLRERIALRSRRTLPLSSTPFVGRTRELAEIRGLLQNDSVRLLTLTAAGGTGKTRVALEVAGQLEGDFSDGVVFVSLASLADPALVAATIGNALSLPEMAGKPAIDQLTDYLADKRLLLVLDNFEHLLDATDVVCALLAECVDLRVLVTSRAALHLSAEHLYPVPPLAVPDPTQLPDLETLAGYDAIRLFIERAQAVKPSFRPTSEDAGALVEICSRVDGLPLAIELAAARLTVFPPQALAVRLQHRLPLLTGGAQDLPARQQTLRSTIDWSYSLLSEEEQILFARLSVFAGGCNFEAAEAVCNQAGSLDMLEGLSSLVDKSLLHQIGDDEPRFAMLETTREYASLRLAASGEAETLQRLHAHHFLALAERAEREMHGPDELAWLDRLERDLDNLRAALAWSLDRREGALTQRLAAALVYFWSGRDRNQEGQSWLRRALILDTADVPARAKALFGAGYLPYEVNEYTKAKPLLEQSLALYRQLGDKRGMAQSLKCLGFACVHQGDVAHGRKLIEESLALARELDDSLIVA